MSPTKAKGKKARTKARGKAPRKAAAKTARPKTTAGKRLGAKKARGSGVAALNPSARKGLSPKDLGHFRNRLLAEKQRVLEEMRELQTTNLKQSITDQVGEISRYSYHLGDTASLSYDREFSMGLAERQQKYLEQIDDALGRIADRTYGICRVTGEPIPRERLEEVPVAKYSVKGKEIVERQKRATMSSSPVVPVQGEPDLD